MVFQLAMLIFFYSTWNARKCQTESSISVVEFPLLDLAPHKIIHQSLVGFHVQACGGVDRATLRPRTRRCCGRCLGLWPRGDGHSGWDEKEGFCWGWIIWSSCKTYALCRFKFFFWRFRCFGRNPWNMLSKGKLEFCLGCSKRNCEMINWSGDIVICCI